MPQSINPSFSYFSDILGDTGISFGITWHINMLPKIKKASGDTDKLWEQGGIAQKAGSQ